MALNLSTLNKPIGPLTKDYTWRDIVLYALGVGAGFDELEYCYEKNLKVIPTFSIAAIFDFFWQAGLLSNVNLAGALHGEQELFFHHPIPTEGRLITQGAITHMYDKGADKGALVVAESKTKNLDGQDLFTSTITIFSRLDGGFGGPNSPPSTVQMPETPSHYSVTDTPSANQPLIYRLSGDLFELHVDPQFAKMAGFEQPIMHGLCTLGFACRHLIASLCPGQPERLKRLACRFAHPLYPGAPINTQIWQTDPEKALWRTNASESDDVIITNGIAEISSD
jgi:acyl dehydratase